ncbi:MAG: DeoR/GlpR family DNA-binding transcription regulator [Lachnospiraceae bacterium]|nr:DeoR/GlpR family DNA-binding transcription regulator [Lachnospiraceae bacterium]
MEQRNRLEVIRQVLRRNKRVIVTELSREMEVTPETIRRDLEKLEKEGILTRIHGGAILKEEVIQEKISFCLREQTNVESKEIIAKLAADLIPMGACVGCDASSTAVKFLHEIRERSDVLVLTNSAKAIIEMADTKFKLLSTGGYVNRQSYSMQRGQARSMLQNYHMDLVLISCKGLGWDGGIYDSHESEIEVKRCLIERGRQVILMLDHTKFGNTAFSRLGGLEAVDMVITDREPDREWMEIFEKYRITVRYPKQTDVKSD